MKYDHILFTCPDPNFCLGSPSPRKLLLEKYSKEYPRKENFLKNEISEDESAPAYLVEEKSVPNCLNTFIAPHLQRGEGFYFPRR